METKKIKSLMILASILFAILTTLVLIEHSPTQTTNDAIYAPFASIINPTLTTMGIWIGSLTHWYTYAPIILLLIILPSTRKDIGIPMAITLSVSAITGPILLKNLFAIERPLVNQLIEPGGFGYPSGHSLNAVVFFGMCTIMVLRYASHDIFKKIFPYFAVISILLVGLSRIYLGVHTATDVIGGYLVGIVILCAAVLIERRYKERG